MGRRDRRRLCRARHRRDWWLHHVRAVRWRRRLAGVPKGEHVIPILAVIALDAMAAIVIGLGVRALLKLGWADRFHHLWFGFAAFALGPVTPAEFVVRCVFLLIAFDDAYQ